MKGINDIRLRIQCANVYDHAKILPIQPFVDWPPFAAISSDLAREMKLYFAHRIGEIICGNSDVYIYRPSDRSPMGKCALCGGALSFEIQDWEKKGKAK